MRLSHKSWTPENGHLHICSLCTASTLRSPDPTLISFIVSQQVQTDTLGPAYDRKEVNPNKAPRNKFLSVGETTCPAASIASAKNKFHFGGKVFSRERAIMTCVCVGTLQFSRLVGPTAAQCSQYNVSRYILEMVSITRQPDPVSKTCSPPSSES